jgi:hypothetical protein
MKTNEEISTSELEGEALLRAFVEVYPTSLMTAGYPKQGVAIPYCVQVSEGDGCSGSFTTFAYIWIDSDIKSSSALILILDELEKMGYKHVEWQRHDLLHYRWYDVSGDYDETCGVTHIENAVRQLVHAKSVSATSQNLHSEGVDLGSSVESDVAKSKGFRIVPAGGAYKPTDDVPGF